MGPDTLGRGTVSSPVSVSVCVCVCVRREKKGGGVRGCSRTRPRSLPSSLLRPPRPTPRPLLFAATRTVQHVGDHGGHAAHLLLDLKDLGVGGHELDLLLLKEGGRLTRGGERASERARGEAMGRGAARARECPRPPPAARPHPAPRPPPSVSRRAPRAWVWGWPGASDDTAPRVGAVSLSLSPSSVPAGALEGGGDRETGRAGARWGGGRTVAGAGTHQGSPTPAHRLGGGHGGGVRVCRGWDGRARRKKKNRE
jgi:hypothetical protein